MLIAILDFEVAPINRPAVLGELRAEAPSVLAMNGNLAFRPYADQLTDTGVAIVHEWANRADFEAYLASASFARLGRTLRPMMTSAPISRRFEAHLIESVAQ